MTYSNNKTGNSGTPLAVDDNTVKGVTTAVSDANKAHKEQKDNKTTITVSKDCTTPNDKDCSTHPTAKLPSITSPSNPYAKKTFAASSNFSPPHTTEHTTEPPKVAPASWSRTFVSAELCHRVASCVLFCHSTATRHCSSSRPIHNPHRYKLCRCKPLFLLHTATRTTTLYQIASPPRQHHFHSVCAVCLYFQGISNLSSRLDHTGGGAC